MRGRDSRQARIMLDPLLDREERRLAGVLEDADNHAVEDRRGAIEDVEMAERHRVEAARVHRDALAHAVPSDGCSGPLQEADGGQAVTRLAKSV